MKEQTGTLVTVSAFEFTGNTLLTKEKLAPAVAPLLNKPLDFKDLQKAAASVAEVYREAGWIVRTFLPAQEIVNGIVRIHIVEAVFGNVTLAFPNPELSGSLMRNKNREAL